MAVLTFNQPAGVSTSVNMLSATFMFPPADAWVYQITSADVTIAYYVPGGIAFQRFSGSFDYSFSVQGFALYGGWATSYQDLSGALSPVLTVTGFFFTVDTWENYLSADDPAGFHNFIFAGNDTISGGTLDDILAGFGGDDRLSTGGGTDWIYGGSGTDTLVASGNRADYTITKADGRVTVVDNRGIDGTAILVDVEAIEFRDGTIFANRAPSLAVHDIAPQHGTMDLAGQILLTATDADGDPLQYQFFDGTTGNGRFRLNGVSLAEGQNLTISETDLAHFDFKTSGSGSDVLWVRVSDGASWTQWKTFTVAPVPNAAPVVSVHNLAPARADAFIAGSSLLSVSDADGDAITQYRFFDGNAGNGYFTLNGVQQAAMINLDVAASDLANFRYVTSTTGAGDTLWVQAYDGYSWSTWKSFNVTAPANAAPAASVSDRTPVRGTTSLAAASLVSVADADGDPITAYKFFDGTQGGGHFRKNGVAQAELVNIDVSAAELATTDFVLGSGNDVLWVQAYDGISWSTWKSFNVAAPMNNAPVVSVSDKTPGRGTATLSAASLFSVTDADGDTITAYKFFDGTGGSGHFRKGGVVQADMVNIDVSSAELATTDFQLGAGSDVLWVQAYDGISWSAWKSFTVFPPANNAPVVTVNQGSLNPAHGTTTITASNFFSTADADGDSITQFRFFDGNAGNGHFELNGFAQAELTNVTINASDLANFRYRVSGTGAGDTLWVQAYDGTAWGAWKSFNVTAPQNAAPVVTIIPGNLELPKNVGSIGQWSFYTFSDPDGDGIVQYRFFDGTVGNGHFAFDGVAQPELQNLTISSIDFAKMSYVAGAPGSGDTLWVQVYDGLAWSDWKSFNVTIQPNQTPVVTVSDLHPWLGLDTIAGVSMVTVSDDDAPVRYRFFDGTVGNGRFQLSGANQAEYQNITVDAADLANFRFATSTAGGDVLWVQAYDGSVWSDWKTFTVAAQAGSPPGGGTGGSIDVSTGGGGGITFTLLGPPPETFFNSTTPTGDTLVTSSYAPQLYAGDMEVQVGAAAAITGVLAIGVTYGLEGAATEWQFWDATTGGGSFRVDGGVQQDHQVIDVMAGQLASIDFLGANAPGADQLWARAHNDYGWGAWKQFSITTLAPT